MQKQDEFKRRNNYRQLINLLISGKASQKDFKDRKQDDILHNCVFTIVLKGWYKYIPYESILKKIHKIKGLGSVDVNSLPDIIDKRISDTSNFLDKSDPHVQVANINTIEKRIDDFAVMFAGNVRSAIVQKDIDDNLSNKVDKAYKSLDSAKNGIYTSLITILGIFVAIMVAIFSGFQSFIDLFKNVNKLGFGKSISLSSVALFGIYLILILLFNGIARLTHHINYRFPIGFNIYLVISFTIIFLLGVGCSRSYVFYFALNHWICRLFIFIAIFILIIISYLVWRYPYNKELHRCHKR